MVYNAELYTIQNGILIYTDRFRAGRVRPFSESSRVESDYFFYYFRFLCISIKKIDNKFYMTHVQFRVLCTKKKAVLHNIKWHNYYRFIKTIRTSKSTLLFFKYPHQSNENSILCKQKPFLSYAFSSFDSIMVSMLPLFSFMYFFIHTLGYFHIQSIIPEPYSCWFLATKHACVRCR